MKSTGIIRKVDDLGRIVLPIELRRTLDIAERDELEIYMENDRIILQKFEPACIFCGSSRSLVSFRRKNVCQECIRKMADYKRNPLNGEKPFRGCFLFRNFQRKVIDYIFRPSQILGGLLDGIFAA